METGFSSFILTIDSIEIGGDLGRVRISRLWSTTDSKRDLPSSYSVKLVRSGQRWRFSDVSEILAIIDDYMAGQSDFNDPNLTTSDSAIPKFNRSTTGYYDVASSDRLLNENLFSESPAVGRINRNLAKTQIEVGKNLFGCASAISSYLFISPGGVGVDQIAVSDECWRRVVVLDDEQRYLATKGRLGTGANAEDFAAPQGLEFLAADMFYVAEDYNNRIKLLSLIQNSDDPIDYVKVIQIPEFNRPVDVDAGKPDQYGGRELVIANSGGNNIIALYDIDPWNSNYHNVRVFTGAGSSVGAFNKPSSVAFGRDPLTSIKTSAAYFIDSGNRRVVRISNVGNAHPQYIAYSDFPDPHTNLSSIGVDNKGEVYVVDKGLGKIYKFSSNLQLLAKHGFLGTGDIEYLHPTSISFTQGSDASGNMLSGLGEVVLTEEWTNDTGIRRLVPGTEIFNNTIQFTPKRLDGTAPARVKGSFYITGHSNLTEELIGPSGAILTTRVHNMVASGLQPYDISLQTSWGSGQYTLRVTAASIYTNSNTDQVTMTVNVNQALTNQRPVVTSISFPSGDSCVLYNTEVRLAAHAHDPDPGGAVVYYEWSVEPEDAGDFYMLGGNEVYFTGNMLPNRALPLSLCSEFGTMSENIPIRSISYQLTV